MITPALVDYKDIRFIFFETASIAAPCMKLKFEWFCTNGGPFAAQQLAKERRKQQQEQRTQGRRTYLVAKRMSLT